MYFDNQPNNVARNNFLFNRPVDYNIATTNFIYVGAQFPYNQLGKYSTCLMLADEENSSDGSNGAANLAGSKVYNNILAGCRIGLRDYGEGALTSLNHGLKNTLIANNTIIMPANAFPNTGGVFGIFLQDNTAPSGTNRNVGTVIANNVIVGYNEDKLIYSARTGALGGITLKNNLYFSAAAAPFGSGDAVQINYATLAQWATNAGGESGSQFTDPQLQSVAHFQSSAFARYQYRNAKPLPGSPALGTGAAQTEFSTNFELTARPATPWNVGAF